MVSASLSFKLTTMLWLHHLCLRHCTKTALVRALNALRSWHAVSMVGLISWLVLIDVAHACTAKFALIPAACTMYVAL